MAGRAGRSAAVGFPRCWVRRRIDARRSAPAGIPASLALAERAGDLQAAGPRHVLLRPASAVELVEAAARCLLGTIVRVLGRRPLAIWSISNGTFDARCHPRAGAAALAGVLRGAAATLAGRAAPAGGIVCTSASPEWERAHGQDHNGTAVVIRADGVEKLYDLAHPLWRDGAAESAAALQQALARGEGSFRESFAVPEVLELQTLDGALLVRQTRAPGRPLDGTRADGFTRLLRVARDLGAALSELPPPVADRFVLPAHLDRLVRAVDDPDLARRLADRVAGPALREGSGPGAGFALRHGDFWGANVLACSRPGNADAEPPFVIDFDRAAWLPARFDEVHLLVHTLGVLRGGFDACLDRLTVADPSRLARDLATAPAASALLEAFVARAGEGDRAGFDLAEAWLWRQLALARARTAAVAPGRAERVARALDLADHALEGGGGVLSHLLRGAG